MHENLVLVCNEEDLIEYHWVIQWIHRIDWNTAGLEKLCWNCPKLKCHWRNWFITAYTGGTTGGTVTAPTHPNTHSREASIPVWNDKAVGYQPASGQVSVKSAFTWSTMHTTSALQMCEHFNITLLCIRWIWAPLDFLCIWGCVSHEISLAQTALAIPVVYIRGCMIGSDLT